MLLWFLGSLIAPLIVLGSLGSHVKRQLTDRGIESPFGRIRILEALVIITMLSSRGDAPARAGCGQKEGPKIS